MVIERIRLKNFKNFENIDLKLGQMNVFVGANAAGKTNLIQAIKFVRDMQKHGIENAISLQSGMEFLQNFSFKGKEKTIISIDFKLDTQMLVQSTKFNTSIIADFNKISHVIEISVNGNNKYKINYEKIVFHFDLKEIDKKLNEKTKFSRSVLENKSHFLRKKIISVVNTNGKVSLETDVSESASYVVLKNNQKLRISELILLYMYPFSFAMMNEFGTESSLIEKMPPKFFDLSNLSIYDFDIKKMKNPASIAAKAELEENGENLALVMKRIFEDKKKFTQFSNLIKDILPFINDIDTENSYDKSISLKVKEKYNPDTAIPGSLLSDGTVSITAILTALYFEDKNLAIFEEPEHGVHPSLISKLMESFYDASKNKQIIITTHSPEVLKNTVKEDIFLLLRKDNGDASIVKPHKNKMVKSFLKNDLGIDQLFIQNLLES